jgi:hypothetical protein
VSYGDRTPQVQEIGHVNAHCVDRKLRHEGHTCKVGLWMLPRRSAPIMAVLLRDSGGKTLPYTYITPCSCGPPTSACEAAEVRMGERPACV